MALAAEPVKQSREWPPYLYVLTGLSGQHFKTGTNVGDVGVDPPHLNGLAAARREWVEE